MPVADRYVLGKIAARYNRTPPEINPDEDWVREEMAIMAIEGVDPIHDALLALNRNIVTLLKALAR